VRGPLLTGLADLHRDEWGRLLALLVAQYRRLDLAEEALADAFEAAARTWPHDGVPANAPAWLLTTARNRVVDRLRSEAVLARKLPLLAVEADLQEEAQGTMADADETMLDERLRLIFLCAHPSLSVESASALTLRLVLGVPTDSIARLFLVSKPTMAARLTRARRRLTGESFALPDLDELPGRVGLLASVIYLAFTSGYLPGGSPELTDEAIRLGRLAQSLLPGQPELDALLALMLIQQSRRDARVTDGRLVPLAEQDRSTWDQAQIGEALTLLTPMVDAPAAPYLLQALIASEHAIARAAEDTDWPRIVTRYDELLALGESPVVRLNRAVAVAEADGPLAGLRALEGVELPGHRLPGVRAELLARAGRLDEARAAYDEAIALCDNDPERVLLRHHRP
jgi:RNA polymerase sigma factor (sigma-70 family)